MQKLLPIHQKNADRIKFLNEYEKGNQPIIRKNPKKYRPDIDCQCVDNVANEVTDFKTAFHWGNPITLVQRGEDKENNSVITEGISILFPYSTAVPNTIPGTTIPKNTASNNSL